MAKIFAGMMLAQMLMRSDDSSDYGGYVEDTDVKVSPFNFGLNSGFKLTKFEWIPNGGKDGAEQEALEIIFKKGETERSYRQFPVIKAFGKNNEEITDRNAPEFKEAVTEFKQRITHVVHAFVDDAVIKQATSKNIPSFKEYCNILKSLFPKNTPEIELDIFMQYQWQIRGEAKRTYLDIPSKRKHGAFICKSVTGTWTAIKAENADDNMQDALKYGKEETATVVDGVKKYTEFHSFKRTGWFMNSNFAKQQRLDGGDNSSSDNTEAGAAMNAGAAPAATDAAPQVSTW